MNTYQLQLVDELNLHGWDLTPDSLTDVLYHNKRHLFLRATSPRTGSQLGSRIRLSVDTHTPSHGISIPSVRSVTVSTERKNWRKSIARWVSLAVMETAEAAEQVRAEKAQQQRLNEDRIAKLAELVSNTGYTVEEFRRRFVTSFSYTGTVVRRIDAFRLDPDSAKAGWSPEVQVQKCARLLTFLEHEGWNLPDRMLTS
jgi:hypothetical protein